MPTTEIHGLFGFCRSGFEGELAAELTERASHSGVVGYVKAERGSAHALFLATTGQADIGRSMSAASLVFARQSLELIAELSELDPKDRVGPICQALLASGRTFGDAHVGFPDSDAGNPLSGLARGLGNALRPALRKAGLLMATPAAARRQLHVVLLDGDHLYLAERDALHGPAWPGGIPRLRLLRDAPSRSALKLEEALLVLLDDREREAWIKPGMSAADLGAAPGGWSWVLARLHFRVAAIDNGPMADAAMATGVVEHLRADGFTWRPPKPIDWVVCDMVEQPRRVAELMGTWLAEGWSRQALFNLKLPMKKRWEQIRICLDLLQAHCNGSLELRARQLYHDREEITVFARRTSG